MARGAARHPAGNAAATAGAPSSRMAPQNDLPRPCPCLRFTVEVRLPNREQAWTATVRMLPLAGPGRVFHTPRELAQWLGTLGHAADADGLR